MFANCGRLGWLQKNGDAINLVFLINGERERDAMQSMNGKWGEEEKG